MARNPESYNPEDSGRHNVDQGPRMGNTGNAEKRRRFVESKTDGEKQALADEVIRALQARNPGDYVDPRVEPLDANRGPKRNPTADGSRLSGKYRRPITRG